MVTATAVVGVAYATATVAQQEDEDDDPAHIATAEAIVIHNEYLRKFTCDFRRSFQGIPKPQKCYSYIGINNERKPPLKGRCPVRALGGGVCSGNNSLRVCSHR